MPPALPAAVHRRVPAAGRVAAVINSLSPLLVVVISVPLLGSPIRAIQIVAGILGTAGVALLVLQSDAGWMRSA